MRINTFSKCYFEFWNNYFLGIALSLMFDFVFTSLFGGIFLCPFYFSIVSFNFPHLHWIQCSAVWIPVLGKQMHRCKQFQFPVSTKLSFTTWDRLLYRCPSAMIPWQHNTWKSHPQYVPLTEQPLGRQCATSITTCFRPAVFWKEKEWCTNDDQPSNCPQKPPSGNRRKAAKFPV